MARSMCELCGEAISQVHPPPRFCPRCEAEYHDRCGSAAGGDCRRCGAHLVKRSLASASSAETEPPQQEPSSSGPSQEGAISKNRPRASRMVGYVGAAVLGAATLASVFGAENLHCVLICLLLVAAIVAGVVWVLRDRMSKVRRVRDLFRQICEIHEQSQVVHISRDQVDEFSRLADECLSLINSEDDKSWNETFPRQPDIPNMRNRIQQMSLLVLSRATAHAVPVSEEIERLALLRQQGMISDHEFQAFSERFKVSTGEKARSIIKAISDLHAQYARGAVSEGNYHAGLWSLLDKLDRKT